jgi:methionine-rich copper-binding protein CopC
LATALLASVGLISAVHLELSRSVPAAFETVDTVSELRLVFNDFPLASTVQVRLVRGGATDVPTSVVRDPRNRRAFRVGLEGPLASGKYVVTWSAEGPEGPAQDSFPFTVARAP